MFCMKDFKSSIFQPKAILFTFFPFILLSCAVKTDLPILDEYAARAETVTVASAQKISIGFDQTQVIKILGSPNIITKSKEQNESWVYDRISEQYEFIQNPNSKDWIFQNPENRFKEARTSKTFIVVIDFDEDGLVKDLSYRYTQY
jgi:outer membrane protein assembly factor BamE (lipoprotein component of BamABCDE complex)